MSLTPLDDIPDVFAGDPQEGLKEVGRYLGPGTKAHTYQLPGSPDTWFTEITVTDLKGVTRFQVAYRPPDHRWTAGDHDSLKREAIKRWLYDLANVVRMYRDDPLVSFDDAHAQRTKAKIISKAIHTAVAKPEPVVARKARPEDAFVARVLARRSTATHRDS